MKGLTTSASMDGRLRRVRRFERRSHAARAPRVLIVTSGLGSGHVRAAEAIARALARLRPDVRTRTLDFWSLMNPGVAATVQQKYLDLVLHSPDLYARLHRLDEHTWRRVIENDIAPPEEVIELIELVTRNDGARWHNAASAIEWALGPYPSDLILYPTACAALPTRTDERAGANVALLRLALLRWGFLRLQGRMQQRLAQFEPDAVVATQMVPAALVSAIKQSHRRWRQLPLIGVLTDFGAHDYWVQPGIDLYCVPHAALVGAPLVPMAHQDGTQRVLATGVPLMPPFERPPAAEVARRRLGVDRARNPHPRVLLLGGGLGLGVDRLAQRVLESAPECSVDVIAGRNDEACARLEALRARHPGRLDVTGWTEQVALHVAAADLVVGKPGGLTVAEVLACGRPLLASTSLQGQESFNVQFLERAGAGAFVPEEDLAGTVRGLLADPQRLETWQANARAAGRRDGARRVALQALRRTGRREDWPNARAAGEDFK